MDPPPPQYEYNVSVIAIFKNETMNLKMWLEHYLWQGVDHFFLIDNGSTDDPHKILQPYIDRGIDRKSTRLNSSHLGSSHAVTSLTQ